MRVWRALFLDSIREAWDQRSLQVIAFLGFSVIVLCFSVSAERVPAAEVMRLALEEVGTFRHERLSGLSGFTSSTDTGLEIVELEAGAPGSSPRLEGTAAVRLPKVRSMDGLITSWHSFRVFQQTGEFPENTTLVPTYEAADRRQFLEERLLTFGFDAVEVHGGEPPSEVEYRIHLAAANAEDVRGAHRVQLLFGAVELPLGAGDLSLWIVRVQWMCARVVVGFLGMMVLLSLTSTFLPTMLQKGRIDLLLARPIGRVQLVLSRWVGGTVLGAAFTAVVVLGCALALQVRTGAWNPWFLGCIATSTLAFATLQAVATLLGVVTRSPTIAALGAIGVWGISSGLASMLRDESGMLTSYPDVRALLERGYTVLPKIGDLTDLNVAWIGKGLSAAAYEARIAPELPDVNWTASLATTAVFTAVVLGIACWRMRARDF